MAVQSHNETEGDHPLEVWCDNCEQSFWTDETMDTACPKCSIPSHVPAKSIQS